MSQTIMMTRRSWPSLVAFATVLCSHGHVAARGRRGGAPARSSLALTKDDDLSMPVRSISVNSVVLPKSVLRDAGRASGIHDAKPPADATTRFAERINFWYRRNGYVFSRVTARGPVRKGKLQFIVSEPRLAPEPVLISYYAAARGPDEQPANGVESSPAPESLDTVSWKRRAQARAALRLAPLPKAPSAGASKLEGLIQQARREGVPRPAIEAAERRLFGLRQKAGLPSLGQLERSAEAGQLVTVGGSTRDRVVARALQLKAGEPFRWDQGSWETLRSCGLFEEAEARAKFVNVAVAVPASQAQRKPKTVFVDGAVTMGGQTPAEPFPAPPTPPQRMPQRQRPVRPTEPPQSRRLEERVVVSLSVVEKDSRPRRRSQHCKIEPGIALAGGRLAGEVAVHDHNLRGRNQQLRVDMSVKNHTEFRASLIDPRLGSRFGFSARAFQRGPSLPGLGGGGSEAAEASSSGSASSSSGSASGSASGAEAGGAAAAASSHFAGPTAGADVSISGQAWRGATMGLSASAEVVPTPWRTATQSAGLLSRPAAPRKRDTPIVLSGNLGCGTMQGGGGGGGVKAGAKASVSRSLPFLTPGGACPDYWRLKCESKVAIPLVELLQRWPKPTRVHIGGGAVGAQADAAVGSGAGGPMDTKAGGRRRLPGWFPGGGSPPRVIGAPAAAAATVDSMAANLLPDASAAIAEVQRKLRRSTFSVRGKATLAADSLPLYESELLGGEGGVVRGYDADELGRTHSSIGATAELMVPLADDGQPIGLAFFTDAGGGTVAKDGDAAGEMALAGGTAVGVGLRYGPIRIDYAFNHKGRKKVHVGLVAG